LLTLSSLPLLQGRMKGERDRLSSGINFFKISLKFEKVVKIKKIFDFFITDIYNLLGEKRIDDALKKEVRRR
jgi:hypothetical protein